MINRILKFFTPIEKPEIDYIMMLRIQPLYYGLRGRGIVRRKVTDSCLCIDLIHGIGNPDLDGWNIDYIQYK